MDKLTIKAPSGKLIVVDGLDHSMDSFKTVKDRLHRMGGFTPEEQSLNYEDLKIGLSGCYSCIFDDDAPINFYKESHGLMLANAFFYIYPLLYATQTPELALEMLHQIPARQILHL